MDKKIRAAVYIRVSTQEQEEKFGPELQRANILNYINVRCRDIEFAGDKYIYQDLAVSGADPIESRKGFSQLINDAKYFVGDEKPFDIVIVYKLDRFARKLNILLNVIDELNTLGVGFISTQEAIDTSTAFGKAMLGIMGVFAELERDMIQERTSAGLDAALKSGVWYRDIFGYKYDKATSTPLVLENEAEIIRYIFDMYVLEQKSIAQICTTLSEMKYIIPGMHNDKKRGVKNIYKWGDKTVRLILENEIYIGNYYYHKQKTETDPKTNAKRIISLPKEQRTLSDIKHTPIVSDDIFYRAQEMLANSRDNTKKYNDYLLSGLLKCDACKASKERGMVSRTGNQSHKAKTYLCTGKNKAKYANCLCHTVPMSQEDLDTLVVTRIRQLIKNPETLLTEIHNTKDLKEYRELLGDKIRLTSAKIAELNNQNENLKELLIAAEIPARDYNSYKENNSKKIAHLEEELISYKKDFERGFDYEAQQKALTFIRDSVVNLETILQDKTKCKKLLNVLINKIVIYSDQKTNLVLPGVKKDIQWVPHTIVIIFKLPQAILNELQILGRARIDETQGTKAGVPIEHSNSSVDGLTSLNAKFEYGPFVLSPQIEQFVSIPKRTAK